MEIINEAMQIVEVGFILTDWLRFWFSHFVLILIPTSQQLQHFQIGMLFTFTNPWSP